MEYDVQTKQEPIGDSYSPTETRHLRSLSGANVELEGAASKAETRREKVHFWRPPCSCGVSLDDVAE